MFELNGSIAQHPCLYAISIEHQYLFFYPPCYSVIFSQLECLSYKFMLLNTSLLILLCIPLCLNTLVLNIFVIEMFLITIYVMCYV